MTNCYIVTPMIKTTLTIDGMRCGACETHLNNLFRKAFSPRKVRSSHFKGETIIIDKRGISREEAEKALEGSGYQLLSIYHEPYKHKFFFF